MWITPHVLKGMRLALSSRRRDHMLPPELMGRLGRRHSEYSEHDIEASCLTVRAMPLPTLHFALDELGKRHLFLQDKGLGLKK